VAEVAEEMLVEQLAAFELGLRERLVGVAQREEVLALEARSQRRKPVLSRQVAACDG